MFTKFHGLIRGFAWIMAIVGGIVLSAMVLMICASIIGRTLAGIVHSGFVQGLFPGLDNRVMGFRIGSIRGDFELVEFGMAFIVFAFLPWCQITAGHATVDIFTDNLRPFLKRVLQAVIEVTFAVVLIYVALKLHEGMALQQRRRTTTFLLQIPVWWSFMAALIPAYLAAGVACYMAAVRVVEAAVNRSLIHAELGAEH